MPNNCSNRTRCDLVIIDPSSIDYAPFTVLFTTQTCIQIPVSPITSSVTLEVSKPLPTCGSLVYKREIRHECWSGMMHVKL